MKEDRELKKSCNQCEHKQPNYHDGIGFCYMFEKQFNPGDICAQFRYPIVFKPRTGGNE